MNQKVVLWIVGLAVVVIAGAALYYAMTLSSQPSLYRPTPTPPPVTTTDELDTAATQNDQDLQTLDANLQDYGGVDPAQDNLGI